VRMVKKALEVAAAKAALQVEETAA